MIFRGDVKGHCRNTGKTYLKTGMISVVSGPFTYKRQSWSHHGIHPSKIDHDCVCARTESVSITLRPVAFFHVGPKRSNEICSMYWWLLSTLDQSNQCSEISSNWQARQMLACYLDVIWKLTISVWAKTSTSLEYVKITNKESACMLLETQQHETMITATQNSNWTPEWIDATMPPKTDLAHTCHSTAAFRTPALTLRSVQNTFAGQASNLMEQPHDTQLKVRNHHSSLAGAAVLLEPLRYDHCTLHQSYRAESFLSACDVIPARGSLRFFATPMVCTALKRQYRWLSTKFFLSDLAAGPWLPSPHWPQQFLREQLK